MAVAAIGVTASPVDARKRPVVITAPHPDQPVERVSYHDLNLVLSSDQKTLYQRVNRAIRNVCPDNEMIMVLLDCRSYARNGAKPQIALAIERATQIAQTGSSSIAAVALPKEGHKAF
jgi:UrcA family protein